MVQWSAVDAGSSGLRAALGEVLARLRRAAVDGVVPEHVFAESVRALALGDAERERLRQELARLGLPVRELQMHTGGDQRGGEKVARDRAENVFPRLSLVQNLLNRYADADGYVTPRVVDGVIRLAGLGAHEAAQLRARALVRDPEGEPDAGNGEGTDEPDASDGAKDAEAEAPGPAEDASAGDVSRGDLAESVAAAHAVLDTDRRVRRPGSRLLSAQAEVGLAVLLRGGPDRIAREPDEDELKALPPEDLRIRARDCLVVHNQRLVHSLARPYQDQGLDYEDLLQHGFLGLLRAARKFDPTMGNKFSTYATWWIRQSITRAIADEGALIRVPVHMHEQMRKVARAERALAAEGRRAGDADVAVRCDMTLQKVQEIRKLTRRTDSLDRVIGDGATLADFVAETHVLPSVERQVVGALFAEDVLAVVDTFTEREARILVRRLGLDGDEPSTLDDLGREFGVTRERIRQIEGKVRPVLRERVREAGLVGLDAACEKAERAAERAAEAKRAARIARATHAARTARARIALRKARAERLARAAGEWTEAAATAASASTPVVGETEPNGDTPIVEAEIAVPVIPREDARAGALTDTDEAVDTTAPDVVAADWGRACRMSEEPVDHLWWLADYARAALGDDGLAAVLGQPAADAVVRDARSGGYLSRPVLTALEVLRRVFDALVAAGRRPEDFFDRPAEALVGATPRAYLVRSPLVDRESRLAVRDSLREFLAVAAKSPEPESGQVPEPERGQVPEPERGQVPEPEVTQVSGSEPASVPETGRPAETAGPAGAPQTTADWDKALTLTRPPLGGGVTWLAGYALLALGHLQLSVLLGSSVTDAVVRAARQRGTLDRPVVEALEVLEKVLDSVKNAGLRPEHFFERPAGALAGATPRAYLATRPLVNAESRLAVGAALAEFVAARPPRTVPASGNGGAGASTVAEQAADTASGRPAPSPAPSTPVEPQSADTEPRSSGTEPRSSGTEPRSAGTEPRSSGTEPRSAGTEPRSAGTEPQSSGTEPQSSGTEPQSSGTEPQSSGTEPQSSGTEPSLAEVRARHEARIALLTQENELRLDQERRRADERVAAVRAEAERQLDAWEEVLLHRADRSRDRREKQVRRQAEEHLARLEEQHRESYEAVLRRAERAEEAARETADTGQRADELEQRLRDYREGAEARIGDLEARLGEARAEAAERERAAGARVAELETRLRKAETTADERERAAASAREEYREGARLRVAEVEARLREAEAAVAQRDLFVEAARRRAEEAEQEAARRIAQSEHDAWLRVTDLQTQLGETQRQLSEVQAQLAAAQEAADRGRGSLRDRWRRS
ncbi:sigma-70 family RNA polymerase sigma factor [Streptomyces sp. NPDC051740]|uniref:sigma-70 family RNA polymerase sigma factor n=1 Tax=Streptomyces sp. NPDC051740 TaxID=3365673 RepID=UPI0037AB40C5